MRWPARTHRRGDRRREEAREGGCEGEDSLPCERAGQWLRVLTGKELLHHLPGLTHAHIQTQDTANVHALTLPHAKVKYLTSTPKDSLSLLNVPSWVKKDSVPVSKKLRSTISSLIRQLCREEDF